MIIPTNELMEYCLKTPNFLPYLPYFFPNRYLAAITEL
jgi:hypothetical protein